MFDTVCVYPAAQIVSWAVRMSPDVGIPFCLALRVARFYDNITLVRTRDRPGRPRIPVFQIFETARDYDRVVHQSTRYRSQPGGRHEL